MRVVLLHCMSPLLAQSGHAVVHCTCLLSGVKRTSLLRMYAATRGILSEIFLNPISKNGELFLPIVSYRLRYGQAQTLVFEIVPILLALDRIALGL